MDIRSLRYFVETVRLNSFTQAAESLNVTQSTVSKMVHTLEYEAGGQLLLRDGRKLVLTDTGRIVYERGQEILSMLGNLKREISDVQDLRSGSLTVGIPPMVNVCFTPVLKAFREKYPDVEVILSEDTGVSVERRVAAGELEIGLTILPTDPALDIVSVELARYPMWAIAKKGTFQDDRKTIKLHLLRDVQLVLLTDDFASSRSLHESFAAAGFVPKIAAQSGHWDWLVGMASAGIGVAVLPQILLDRIVADKLQLVQIVEPVIEWKVAQIWSPTYLSCAARAWLEICRDVFANSLGVWPPICEAASRTFPPIILPAVEA